MIYHTYIMAPANRTR